MRLEIDSVLSLSQMGQGRNIQIATLPALNKLGFNVKDVMIHSLAEARSVQNRAKNTQHDPVTLVAWIFVARREAVAGRGDVFSIDCCIFQNWLLAKTGASLVLDV